jgi:hypothetical protein
MVGLTRLYHRAMMHLLDGLAWCVWRKAAWVLDRGAAWARRREHGAYRAGDRHASHARALGQED